jgi:hypothetical protein
VAEADDDINDQIDAAYRTKYRRHGGTSTHGRLCGVSRNNQAGAALDDRVVWVNERC